MTGTFCVHAEKWEQEEMSNGKRGINFNRRRFIPFNNIKYEMKSSNNIMYTWLLKDESFISIQSLMRRKEERNGIPFQGERDEEKK